VVLETKIRLYLDRLRTMPLKNLNLFVKTDRPVPGFEYENYKREKAFDLCKRILEERQRTEGKQK